MTFIYEWYMLACRKVAFLESKLNSGTSIQFRSVSLVSASNEKHIHVPEKTVNTSDLETNKSIRLFN